MKPLNPCLGFLPLCSGEMGSKIHVNFSHNAMPYPGVESYKVFRNLIKEGKLPYLRTRNEKNKFQAELKVSVEFPLLEHINYRDWNIITLTQNYIIYLFYLLREKDKGILLHCISGWDRTPLWIGIMRILLWAEGLIHRSLDAEQLTYLVIAYDWLLFGHQLAKRLKENSEIMYCAFWLLQYLTDELYSFSNTKIPEPEKTCKNFQVPHSRRATSIYNIKATVQKVDKEPLVRSRPTTLVDLIKDKESLPHSVSTPTIKKPILVEQEMIPMPCLRDKTTPSEREKKILEVWDIFKTIYSKVIC